VRRYDKPNEEEREMHRVSADTYSRTAIVLHWAIAALVLAQIALGWWMIDIPKDPPGIRAGWFNVHKSIGITAGVLAIVRIAWRFTHPAPPLPDTLPAWQRAAARVSHFWLYLCLFTMPLTGYLGSNFTKYPIRYFGHTLPYWGWDAPPLKALMSQIHYATVVIFMIVIAIHVAAAFRHLFVRDDHVFRRMWCWPGKTRRRIGARPVAGTSAR
jgi:cytochrome b561